MTLHDIALPAVNDVFHPDLGAANMEMVRGVPTFREKFFIHKTVSLRLSVRKYKRVPHLTTKLEFNPSRVAYPNPADGNATPAELARILKTVELYFASTSLHSVDLSAPGVRVTRLDLARDFVVEGTSPSSIVNGLYPVRRPWRPKVELVRSGPDPETIVVSTNSYRVNLYDQEKRHRRPMPTQLRFESQLRSEQLEKFGLRSVLGITPARCEEALRYFWERSRMGERVANPDSLMEHLYEAGFRGKELGNLYGYASVRAFGRAGDYEEKHRRKLEKQLESAGVSALAPSLERSGRLCLESGRFVPC